jgi:hypothetical protein
MTIMFHPPHPAAAPEAAPDLLVTPLPLDRVLVIVDLCDTLEGILVRIDADQLVEAHLLAGGLR